MTSGALVHSDEVPAEHRARCAQLPPGQLHCLENTGSAMLRVLGVFHPADSPAAKNSPD